MPKQKRKSKNKPADKYNFVLNPYPDMRMSSCPFCNRKSGQRKLPLFIYIEPDYPVALNYTNRYCRPCDLLIAHKHELEHLLTAMFAQTNPAIIGNEYMVMGTVDKKAWRAGLKQPKPIAEMLSEHISYFKTYYKELRSTQPGWYPEGVEPPEMPPPPSTEWVKQNPGKR